MPQEVSKTSTWRRAVLAALDVGTQCQLAKYMGVSQPAVSQWATGETKPLAHIECLLIRKLQRFAARRSTRKAGAA